MERAILVCIMSGAECVSVALTLIMFIFTYTVVEEYPFVKSGNKALKHFMNGQ